MGRHLLRRAVKRLVSGTIGRYGYEVRCVPHAERNKDVWLKQAGIRTILDVGANTGQFAKGMLRLLPEAKIYSFEPLAECIEKLGRLAAAHAQLVVVPYACGDKEEQVEMFHSQYSPSSSILRMTHRHEEIYPNTLESRQETVTVKRLDDLAVGLEIQDELMVKLDVQGFEDRVIRGGRNTLRRARLVLTEVSFETLYEGQASFETVYALLRELGLEFSGFRAQYCHAQTGLPVQADAIFLRRP